MTRQGPQRSVHIGGMLSAFELASHGSYFGERYSSQNTPSKTEKPKLYKNGTNSTVQIFLNNIFFPSFQVSESEIK